MKKVLSLLLTITFCINLLTVVVHSTEEGPVIEGPVDWINQPLEGSQLKAPMDNTFKVEGSNKKFTLLDTNANNADSKWLVFTQDYYGTRRFDKTGNKSKHKFDVKDTDNIAYWLNNDFLANGNICCGGELKLPSQIIENINMQHVWRTEVGHPGSICDADKVGAKYFENTCGVVMMAFNEFVYYNGKYGTMDDAICTCQADNWDVGWWLRSPNGQTAVLSSMYGEKKGTVQGWGADGNINVRPMFYLKESFVKTVKIDARMLGKNVKKAILETCTIEELKKIGYSDSEIELISDVNSNSTEQIDIMSGDHTIGINAKPSFYINVLTNVDAAQEYRVEWNVPGVARGNSSFTPRKGENFSKSFEVDIKSEGTYNADVKLYIGNTLAKSSVIPLSYIDQYKPEFMDEYREKGVATHFAMGGNTPDLKNIELLKSAGIKLVRDEIFWSTLEKQKGVYDFSYPDSYLNPLADAGIEFLVVLDYHNALYYEGTPTTAAAIEGYCNYAKAVAARYPAIKAFEIWNEPNLEHFWGGTPNAGDYAKLVRAAGEAIKSVRPDAKVYGGVTSDADVIYMRTFLEGDVYDFIDGISIHPYCYPHPADQGKIEGRINSNRKLIEQYGGFKDVIITEFGWSTYTGEVGTTEEGQARDIVKEFAISDEYDIAYNTVYDFKDDGTNPDDAEHNYGMIQEYYNPKPSYYATKTFNQVIGGAEYCGKISLADGIRAYVYSKDGEPVVMVWSVSRGDAPGEAKNVDFGSTVNAVDMFGKSMGSGSQFSIGANPVYITDMPDQILLQASAQAAIKHYQRIQSEWGSMLDSSSSGKSISHKIEQRINQLESIASGEITCDYQLAQTMLNENYEDGDKLIFEYHNNKLNMDFAGVTVLLDVLHKAGTSIGRLVTATIPTDIMPPKKLNSPKVINRAKEKISGVPAVQAQYAKAVLRQSMDLSDIASGLLVSKAQSPVKSGVIFTYDLLASKLGVWAENLVKSGDEPYVNILVEGGEFTLTGSIDNPLQKVTLEVLKPQKTVADILDTPMLDLTEVFDFVGETNASEAGLFSFNYKTAPVTGEYSVRVNSPSWGNIYEGKFKMYANTETILKDIINSTTVTEMISSIDKYKEYFSDVSGIFKTCADKSYDFTMLAQALFAEKNEITDVDILIDKIEFNLVLQYIADVRGVEEFNKIVNDYSYILNYQTLPAFSTYKASFMNDEIRGEIVSALSKDKSLTVSARQQNFELNTVLISIANIGYRNVMNILNANNKNLRINFDDYYKLTAAQQESVCVAFSGRMYTSYADAKANFDKCVANAPKEEKHDKPSSGGGGGGGKPSTGGGSGAVVEPSIENENLNKDVFADLGSVEWAKDSIMSLYNKGIINGKEDGVFAPNDNVVREEFLKMLVGALGEVNTSATADFEDVSKDDWSYPYIATGKELGIVLGESETIFGTGKNITREQMAVLCDRMLAKKDIKSAGKKLAFDDDDQISEYAKEAVGSLAGIGIINGVGDGMFAPLDFATRAEAAVIINRMLQLK